MTTFLNVEINNKIAVVTIDNPPLNVISKAIFEELGQVFSILKDDDSVSTVILTGKGSKAFAAGADIKEFPQLMGNPHMKEVVMQTHHVLNEIDDFPKPTLAVLNGMTFGGGCELALCCDIRIAESHATLALPEVTLGLFPGGGGTQRLPRLIGEARAKEMMYTGDTITAKRAEAMGLVNQVVDEGNGLSVAKKLAAKIAGHSLQSLSRIKKAIDEGSNLALQDGLKREIGLFVEVFQTEDIKEGVKAFIEKRKPQYINK